MIKDGDWTLLEWDAHTGRTVWHMFDGEKTVIRTDYPITATVAENEKARNEAGKAWTGDWHRIASVPLNIYHEQLAEAERQGDKKFISSWLNDSDNRAWRTKEGRV
ncbi:hypothetical protein DKP76_11510 [Falsochrobactrum shanghaiense]|uniref:Uncharacterized protein n=1 Tax=Falsochrobactrum shanghaiense TaxID=2201899 RepID=A0A316J8B3_9HYPH|nr:hypothetical protein [Falsochrobactrum shanghaiense]PWL17398.1 hypothetical protein DKP76_11510 [Falsochrobactrum shanghaiense]